jgi:hypothetical protein
MENQREWRPLECELCSFHWDPLGILTIVAKDVARTYEKQLAALAMIDQITDGIPVSLVLDLRETSLILYDSDTREYLARRLPFMFKAVAVIAVTTLQKVAPTIFLNTVGEPVPIRMFETEVQAAEWLRQFG